MFYPQLCNLLQIDESPSMMRARRFLLCRKNLTEDFLRKAQNTTNFQKTKNYTPNALIGLAVSGRTITERLELDNRFLNILKIRIQHKIKIDKTRIAATNAAMIHI
ncbi:hypothetical protein DINM_006542 [Dirofilaria immitis]|nr:hypothetical protein [Dirofilaria immitis]